MKVTFMQVGRVVAVAMDRVGLADVWSVRRAPVGLAEATAAHLCA